jgi:hypothetical protein
MTMNYFFIILSAFLLMAFRNSEHAVEETPLAASGLQFVAPIIIDDD